MTPGAEQITEVATSLGPVWLWGRDTGRPILLLITGSFASRSLLDHLQKFAPGMDYVRVHLPGNHCPPLSEVSVAAFSAAITEAIDRQWPGRAVFVAGLSVGALVAMGLRSAGVRRLLLVEPTLNTGDMWPLHALRTQASPGEELFVKNVFGIGPTTHEPVDYTPLLDALEVPAHVLLGDVPLLPPRQLNTMPSLVDEESRKLLVDHPLISVGIAPGAGHNVVKHAPYVFFDALRALCSELAPA